MLDCRMRFFLAQHNEVIGADISQERVDAFSNIKE